MSGSDKNLADVRAKKFTFTNALGLNKIMAKNAHSQMSQFADTEYRVTFSIDIDLAPGEDLAVSGDLPSLGMWTDFSKFAMVRASGNSYVSAKPFVTDKFFF